MSFSSQPSTSSVGRLTGFMLVMVVIVCISLIGLCAYVKYELDRAENALATPELQLTADQQTFDKMRRDLGYGGFIGLAQTFAAAHDPATLPDMKAQLKLANESLEHLPESTAAETRHDLQAILTSFDAVMDKAEKSTAAPPAPDFSTGDLAPLYAALPILDARVATALNSNRTMAQSQTQFWATLLTIISWASLVIASALAAGIYLVLRDRNSAPVRALAQSVKNMARGDMRSSIWGMERQDAIGDLARSIDMARFHFSQLPDMSLLSEEGPVRIRFEGNTRSLFEAMMRVISRDSEQVHEQANAMTQAVTKQEEALSLVIERVEAVLQSVENRAVSGDQQVRQALQGMLGSAESLKHAQEHAADQLNRIIPFLQERSQGMSDIAQITGKQITQVLQSLNTTERGLRSSAEHSEAAIRKFSSTADTLGERMFGAVNLLQASGKVLAETTETTQSRLEQAIERIGSASAPPAAAEAAVAAPAPFDYRATERLEGAVAALETTHNKLEQLLAQPPVMAPAPVPVPVDSQAPEHLGSAVSALEAAHARLETLLAEQTEATRAHIDLLTTQSSGLLLQSSTSSQTLSIAADRLRDEQNRLGEILGILSARLDTTVAPNPHDKELVTTITSRLDQLGQHITQAMGALAGLPQQVIAQTTREPAFAAPLLADIKDGFASIAQSIQILHGQIATLQAAAYKPDAKPDAENGDQMRDHWYQMAAQIEATRSSLAQVIMQQTDRVEAHLATLTKNLAATSPNNDFARDTQNQMEQQTLILNELVATLSLLDAHMQELRSQVTASRQRAG